MEHLARLERYLAEECYYGYPNCGTAQVFFAGVSTGFEAERQS